MNGKEEYKLYNTPITGGITILGAVTGYYWSFLFGISLIIIGLTLFSIIRLKYNEVF